MSKAKVTEADLIRLLQLRCPAREHALLRQVASGTGGAAKRYADVVTMNLWPSRGLAIHGYEIKVSRSDWLRELKDPAKADEIASFCDAWWLLVADEEIVKPGELPAGWGLLVPNKAGTELRAVVQAGPLAPQPLTRVFVAALLRRASETQGSLVARAEIAGEVAAAHDRGVELGKQWGAQDNLREHRRLEELEGQVRAFEEASGVKLQTWKHPAASVGAALKLVLEGGVEGKRTELVSIRDRLQRAAALLTELVEPKAEGM